MVVGEPGVGKTTFVKALCKSWTSPGKLEGEELNVVKDYTILLAIILPQIKEEDTLVKVVLDQFPEITVPEVFSVVKHVEGSPEEVCIICDGLDELQNLPFNQILEIILGTEAKCVACITTTRAEGVEKLMKYNADSVKTQVVLSGFDHIQVGKYIDIYFKKNRDNAKSMTEYITGNKLWKLAKIPIRLQMMCLTWSEHHILGGKLVNLYEMFITGLLAHMEKKENVKLSHKSLIEKYHETVLFPLAKLANTWDKHGRLKTFFSAQVLDIFEGDKLDTVMKSGIIIKSILGLQWTFSHVTIQEYFIAYLLNTSNMPVVDEFTKVFSFYNMEKHNLAIRFMCQLDPEKADRIIRSVTKTVRDEQNCTKMLNLLLAFMNEYVKPLTANLTLPKIVSIGGPWFGNFEFECKENVQNENKVTPYLSCLLNRDSSSKSVQVLKIHDLNFIDNRTNCKHATVVYLNVKRNQDLNKAGDILSSLQKVQKLQIDIDVKISPKLVSEHILYKISTQTITLLCVKGPGVFLHASHLMHNMQNLTVLSIKEVQDQEHVDQACISQLSDAIKLKPLKQLIVEPKHLDNSLVSLAERVSVSIRCSHCSLDSFDQFVRSIRKKDLLIPLIDLSFAEFRELSAAKPLGILMVHIECLRILRLRACGITSQLLSKIGEVIRTSNQDSQLLELDLLGNPITRACDLKSVLDVCTKLDIILFSCEEESEMPESMNQTKVMATSMKEQINALYVTETMSAVTELYIIHTSPDFSRISLSNMHFSTKILFLFNLPEDSITIKTLPSALRYMLKLTELHYTSQKIQKLKPEVIVPLVNSLPPSLTHLNLSGYQCDQHIFEGTYDKLQFLEKFNIGYSHEDSEITETIRHKLRQMNEDIDVYYDDTASVVKLLSCSSDDLDSEIGLIAKGEELLASLAK